MEKVEVIISDGVRDGLSRWVAIKLIERDEMVLRDLDRDVVDGALSVVTEFESAQRDDGVQLVASARYAAGDVIRGSCLTKAEDQSRTALSDRVDRILLNRVLAIPIFVAVMYLVYYICIQTVGTMGSDFINDGFVEWVKHNVGVALLNAGVETWLNDLITTGIIGGVGAVLGFLPLIIVLFLLLAILEEIGYMARVAYVLDRIFTRFGLSGKAVIPAVIGVGCGVPAIMGTRTIEDESSRNVSVMATTFMPCSAKLPILTVIVAAFFHSSAAVTLGLYLLGIVMILVSGLFLKKFTGFMGKPSPFVMELPVYHLPTVTNVVTSVTEKSWAFVRKAGTLILLSAVIIWVLSSYNWALEYLGDTATSGSMLADLGNAITWMFLPNGFGEHWQMSVASITGLMAKENLLSTVAVLLEAAVDADDIITSAALAKFCTSGVAMSFLIFNLLCAPCFAAIGAMHRELRTWRRTLVAVLYQCCTAYAVSTIYYQLWLVWNGQPGLGIVLVAVFVAIPVYVIVSRRPFGFIRDRLSRSVQ
ncbi:MAG: ferrous iron transporter B [archaeon]|nr:ferrous iron transporter B [archaeon]